MEAFERKLNLLVGFPSNGLWNARFGMCLANMLGYFMATPVKGYRDQRIQPMQIRGSILPRSRTKLVQEAQKQRCTHLLFIDTDQTFPRDTAHRLLQWRKDVVACNIATKQIPATTTARAQSSDSPGGVAVYTEANSKGLEVVWRIGTGVMLLDMRVFQKIGVGCFEIRWDPSIQDYRGEDWSMCASLEAAQIPIYVDHGLSNEVGHIGDYEYTHDVVGEKVLREEGKTLVEL